MNKYVPSSMSSHSGWSDTDGPLTVSSGIDAACLSDSSLGSEILETMPSSADGMGQDLLQSHTQPNGGLLLQRATWGKELVEVPSTGFRMEASTKADPDKITEGALRHPQHTKGWPGTRSHKPWRMGENNIELPTMDHMMTDATTTATETNGHVCGTTSTPHPPKGKCWCSTSTSTHTHCEMKIRTGRNPT